MPGLPLKRAAHTLLADGKAFFLLPLQTCDSGSGSVVSAPVNEACLFLF